MTFFTFADFAQNNVFKKFLQENFLFNSLDPNQARHFVSPDLGPNCLQKLSADQVWQLHAR